MHAPYSVKNFIFCTLSLAALVLAGCGDDDNPVAPGDPVPEAPPTIMVLSDGGTETHVAAIMSEAGFEVRDGGLFYEFDGSGLDGVDAVVLLTGVDYDYDMNDEGEWALASFVAGGGGLVTTEWLNYSIDRSGFHQVIQGVLPVTYGGSYSSGSETYTVMVDHPVTEGLPETFVTGSETEYSVVSPKSGALQLVRGDASGHALVTWTRGGRVVSWNVAGEYGGQDVWNADIDQLFVNAVEFVSAPRAGSAFEQEFNTIRFRATRLTVLNDGDGPAGSSSQGDFFITVRISAEIAGEEVELGRQDGILVQATDGQIVPLDIAVTAHVPRIDGQRVTARISYYENDPDGPQASAGDGMVLVYEAASECWSLTYDDDCIDESIYETGVVYLEDFNGDPLDAELRWRLGVD